MMEDRDSLNELRDRVNHAGNVGVKLQIVVDKYAFSLI